MVNVEPLVIVSSADITVGDFVRTERDGPVAVVSRRVDPDPNAPGEKVFAATFYTTDGEVERYVSRYSGNDSSSATVVSVAEARDAFSRVRRALREQIASARPQSEEACLKLALAGRYAHDMEQRVELAVNGGYAVLDGVQAYPSGFYVVRIVENPPQQTMDSPEPTVDISRGLRLEQRLPEENVKAVLDAGFPRGLEGRTVNNYGLRYRVAEIPTEFAHFVRNPIQGLHLK